MTDKPRLRVLITRPLKQAEPWAQALLTQGFDAQCVPMLALEPITDEAGVQAIKNCVLEFDRYHKAIFVSMNAVDFAMNWLDQYWPQLPMATQYFAVGDTTAKALAAWGVSVSALQHTGQGAMTSETLLVADELHNIADEKIIIFRGDGGRGHMGEILRARGASVDYCELYRRVIPTLAEVTLLSLVAADEWQPDVIAVHSGESLHHLETVLQQMTQLVDGAGYVRQLKQAVLLVPGERVAGLARAAGFDRVVVAENATDNAMGQALERLVTTLSSSLSD